MHVLPGVVAETELVALRSEIAAGEWIDGRDTAGALARRVKHNEELREAGSDLGAAQRRVVEALGRCELLQSVALPRRLAPPMFSRYRLGMHYGRHVDNALLSGMPPMRNDLAITVFLSDPKDYDGGELVVLTPAGEAEFKLPAGHAVVYPATMQHWVEPVRRGERVAAILWVQSLVRDAALRELLHDLNVVLARLLVTAPDSDETALLAKTYANLLRRFADP